MAAQLTKLTKNHQPVHTKQVILWHVNYTSMDDFLKSSIKSSAQPGLRTTALLSTALISHNK